MTARLKAEWDGVIQTPFPANARYPVPQTPFEVENRLHGMGLPKGPLTQEEEAWYYNASAMIGLSKLGGAKEHPKPNDPPPAPPEPARANIVGFALSQVGLVEAETGVPDPDGSGNRVRKGIEHLNQYYVETGRGDLKGSQLDPSIPVGPKGGNVVGSWCQIFSQWAVEKGGGTFTGGQTAHMVYHPSSMPEGIPKAGDVAYSSSSQHMAVVVSVEGTQVTTVDGNMPPSSGCFVMARSFSWWDQGIYNSFP